MIAACGSSSTIDPNGPYASPRVSPPAQIVGRMCASPPVNRQATDTDGLRILLIRQGTDLGRISDDLTGAVPGGNFPVDTGLAKRDAEELTAQIKTSALCEPFKGRLVAAAKDLVDADTALAASDGTAGAADLLTTSQMKYQAINDLINNPPNA